MLRAIRTAVAVLPFLLGGPSSLLAQDSLDMRAEATFTADSNVTRARNPQDRLSDRAFGLTLGKGLELPVGGSEHVRLLVSGSLGTEQFQTYKGLSRIFAGADAELQYRQDAEFGTPTFSAFLRASRDEYDSALRDGSRYSVGISVRKPVTDRIDLFAALASDRRHARNAVFDTRERSARLNVDYSLTPAGTLYLGAEVRRGDVVTTTPDTVATGNIARAEAVDDAFTNSGRVAYRVEARSVLATLGFNLALAKSQALDISWRFVRSTPIAGSSAIRYDVNQLSLSWLAQF